MMKRRIDEVSTTSGGRETHLACEAVVVAPLRKRQQTGDLYRRDPTIESMLAELAVLTRDELAARAAVTQRSDVRYVPSECLVYFIRASRDDNGDFWFERLYRILSERVLRSVPRPEMDGDRAISATREKVRDKVYGRFAELLSADRTAYEEKLDFYEIRFDAAVANLRRDAQSQAWREENRSEPLEFDDESGELSPEVEAALQSQAGVQPDEFHDQVYRSLLDAAIDALPHDQRRVIHMLRQGFPIDSKEPGVLTISKALGCSEKTIRNYRDRAFAALREAMPPGSPQ